MRSKRLRRARHSLDRGGVSPTTCTNSLFLADLTSAHPASVIAVRSSSVSSSTALPTPSSPPHAKPHATGLPTATRSAPSANALSASTASGARAASSSRARPDASISASSENSSSAESTNATRRDSLSRAADACANAGKRLCTTAEWMRACQGPDGWTFPYGDVENSGACNTSRASHPVVDLFGAKTDWSSGQMNDPRINQQADTVDPGGANPDCVSAEAYCRRSGWAPDSPIWSGT